ncbi:PRK domain-containing protein/F-box-like domain-containing protein [Cephalotus follicularis]|uniref:PRK domain-containing protein/F-box-like domain-containing protein n=1 Tax=Cephalotus follicularis TaxID=3775 RepID=A0A1Q3BZI8_CEPFO|nr:PRK domain-containing protein/F-box-like domain-containing protein [Cephalotus follicularis]
MQYHHQQHHASPSATPISSLDFRPAKRRGSYNCGRCGLPKKGHSCHLTTTSSTSTTTTTTSTFNTTPSAVRPPPAPPRQQQPSSSHLRRALSFDDIDIRCDSPEPEFHHELFESDSDLVGGLPAGCLWEVLRRLPPTRLLSAARVCKGWRDTAKRLWRAAEELRLRVPVRAQVGFVGSVLQKCPGLVRLNLRMESDVDATMLACIAFSCPNLEMMEISTSDTAVNRITGDELGRFVADKRCLTSLKMEGCTNVGGFVLCSTSLSTLWLSDLQSLSKMVFSCPNLKEISLEFYRQENDSTDLTSMVDGLGISCPRLQNVHIASVHLSHAVVLALAAANLRGLRMLSLVLGSEITDASVAAIASSYSKLELLDLSGSSISDSGIGMICNVYPHTLSRLLLALCPNITSSGIQFATAQLPLLELMDCGMTISDPNSQESYYESSDPELQKMFNNKLHLIYQKLIIKHNRLRRLSLWGCSGLDALYLNCPELNELNLNSCTNLHPERLLLQCPNIESVHASGCHKKLVGAIQGQVSNAAAENNIPCKRLPDGSKRVQVPSFLHQVLCSQNKDIPILEARCMDEVYDALARRLLPTSAVASNISAKYIVGLAGPPGAGKSTLAAEVVRRVNKLWPEKACSLDSQVEPADVAIVLPMDGFHLYRSQLDAMEDPEEAHARRGAPWTFSPSLLLNCLKNLRKQGSVYAPSFDHGIGDPIEDDIFVSLQHKVVIVEGNYIFLEEGIWKDVSCMFDEKWFIWVDLDIAMQRVLKRHISTGKAPDVAKWRIEYNDRPNAELIINSKKNADLLIRSIDF